MYLFKRRNYLDYPLTPSHELGYLYPDRIKNIFTFIGQDKRIIGVLEADATADDIDVMLKRTKASFHGLYLTKISDTVDLSNRPVEIDISRFFRYSSLNSLELSVYEDSNPDVVLYSIEKGKLLLTPYINQGTAVITLRASIPGQDVFVQTEITVTNFGSQKDAYVLSAHPNPFNPVTNLSFTLETSQYSELMVYDVNGRIVSEISKGILEKGDHFYEFDGNQLSAGTYFVVLRSKTDFITKKIMLVK